MEKTQKSRDRYRLTSEEVCAVFEVESFEFENTEKLDPLEGVIGQDRAVHAIQFGLGMSSFGYNIYAAGIPGTGKKSLIRSFVKRLAAERETPPDIFYVHNFQQPDHPQAIQVPSGVGSEFKRDMEECVLDLKREIPKIFQSGDYQNSRTKPYKRSGRRERS